MIEQRVREVGTGVVHMTGLKKIGSQKRVEVTSCGALVVEHSQPPVDRALWMRTEIIVCIGLPHFARVTCMLCLVANQ